MFSESQNSARHFFRRFYGRIYQTGLIVMLMSLITAFSGHAEAESPRLFRIGTGGLTGVYYPIGKIIALGITGNTSIDKAGRPGENGVPGYLGVAQNSAGSIENAIGVSGGEIEAGLVQADVAARALQGEREFKGKTQVRTIRAVASLYPEKFQIVTRQDAGVKTVEDLRGKRISVDELGSGTLAVMGIVLDAHGMSEKDLLPVYLKPVFTEGKLLSGELQGFAIMGGIPVTAVTRLQKSGLAVSLVPISPEISSRIEVQFPYLVPGNIPANVYPGIPEVHTVQVYAILVVDEKTDEKLIYQITAALWSERTLSMLKAGHPQGKAVTPETALTGISIPLHEGAKRYYREHRKRFNYVD